MKLNRSLMNTALTVVQLVLVLAFALSVHNTVMYLALASTTLMQVMEFLNQAPVGTAQGVETWLNTWPFPTKYAPALPAIRCLFSAVGLGLLIWTVRHIRILLDLVDTTPISWRAVAEQTRTMAKLFLMQFGLTFVKWIYEVTITPPALRAQEFLKDSPVAQGWIYAALELLMPDWTRGTTALLIGGLLWFISDLLLRRSELEGTVAQLEEEVDLTI